MNYRGRWNTETTEGSPESDNNDLGQRGKKKVKLK